MSGLSWRVGPQSLLLAEPTDRAVAAADLSVTFGNGRGAMWLSRLVRGPVLMLALVTAAVLALRVEFAGRLVVPA